MLISFIFSYSESFSVVFYLSFYFVPIAYHAMDKDTVWKVFTTCCEVQVPPMNLSASTLPGYQTESPGMSKNCKNPIFGTTFWLALLKSEICQSVDSLRPVEACRRQLTESRCCERVEHPRKKGAVPF